MPTKKTANSKATNKAAASFSLISDATLREMYTAMVGCRLLEERARKEARSRQSAKQQPVGNAPSRTLLGQEAVIVGTTLELRPEDTITAPSGEVIFRPRSSAGRTRSVSTAKANASQAEQALTDSRRNVIAFAASSGAQLTIGTGIALANKDNAPGAGAHRVVVAFGDADPLSLGSWSEALYLAGKHQLPILFVLRPAEITANNTVASICEYAKLAGVMNIPVDSTDIVAMYRVSFESIARARKATGATLILATHYALDGAAKNETTDPILRMEDYLAKKGLFSAKWKAEVQRQFK